MPFNIPTRYDEREREGERQRERGRERGRKREVDLGSGYEHTIDETGRVGAMHPDLCFTHMQQSSGDALGSRHLRELMGSN